MNIRACEFCSEHDGLPSRGSQNKTAALFGENLRDGGKPFHAVLIKIHQVYRWIFIVFIVILYVVKLFFQAEFFFHKGEEEREDFFAGFGPEIEMEAMVVYEFGGRVGEVFHAEFVQFFFQQFAVTFADEVFLAHGKEGRAPILIDPIQDIGAVDIRRVFHIGEVFFQLKIALIEVATTDIPQKPEGEFDEIDRFRNVVRTAKTDKQRGFHFHLRRADALDEFGIKRKGGHLSGIMRSRAVARYDHFRFVDIVFFRKDFDIVQHFRAVHHRRRNGIFRRGAVVYVENEIPSIGKERAYASTVMLVALNESAAVYIYHDGKKGFAFPDQFGTIENFAHAVLWVFFVVNDRFFLSLDRFELFIVLERVCDNVYRLKKCFRSRHISSPQKCFFNTYNIIQYFLSSFNMKRKKCVRNAFKNPL